MDAFCLLFRLAPYKKGLLRTQHTLLFAFLKQSPKNRRNVLMNSKPKGFRIVLTLLALSVLWVTPDSIGDNENGPRHSHVSTTYKFGYCGFPTYMIWGDGDCSYTEACYTVYSAKTTECSHGISCAGGCHYQVSDEHEHLEWCDVCEVNYYNCQERHYDS